MKKEVTIIDPVSGEAKTIVVSKGPLTATDVLSIAVKGYIVDLKNKKEYPSTAVLNRSNALMIAKTKLPFKSTTIVSNPGDE